VSADELKAKYVALRDRSDKLEGAVSDAILELRRQLKLGHDARRRAARARLDDAAKNWRAKGRPKRPAGGPTGESGALTRHCTHAGGAKPHGITAKPPELDTG